jgi:hypothetical protein
MCCFHSVSLFRPSCMVDTVGRRHPPSRADAVWISIVPRGKDPANVDYAVVMSLHVGTWVVTSSARGRDNGMSVPRRLRQSQSLGQRSLATAGRRSDSWQRWIVTSLQRSTRYYNDQGDRSPPTQITRWKVSLYKHAQGFHSPSSPCPPNHAWHTHQRSTATRPPMSSP